MAVAVIAVEDVSINDQTLTLAGLRRGCTVTGLRHKIGSSRLQVLAPPTCHDGACNLVHKRHSNRAHEQRVVQRLLKESTPHAFVLDNARAWLG